MSEIPQVPQRPQRKEPTASNLPPVPRTRPQRTVLQRANTDSSIEVTPDVPGHRPARRSTTEELDQLIESASEQLVEIEEFVAVRHGHATSKDMGLTTTSLPHGVKSKKIPAIPQRPQKRKEDTSENKQELQNREESTKDVANVTKEEITQEKEEEEETGDVLADNSQTKETPQDDASDELHDKSLAQQLISTEKQEQEEIPVTQPKEEQDIEEKKQEVLSKEVGSPVEETNEQTLKSEDEQTEPVHQPVVPQRPKKRTPPPPIKKPSSRIAAFQEMLQKQQLEQTRALPTRAAGPSGNSENKKNFVNSLNGMIGLPGMVPPQMPGVSLSSSPPAEEKTTNKDASLVDIRQRRTKGPRGRKLPSKVSTVEKVTSTNKSNEIELFDTWSICTASPKEKHAEGHLELEKEHTEEQLELENGEVDPEREPTQDAGLLPEEATQSLNEIKDENQELPDELRPEHDSFLPETMEDTTDDSVE